MLHHHFGTARRLFGSLEQPGRLHARSAAVLLLNPFGEEAVRAHRIYRVLAEQLGRAGFDVMRFDYSGTGDSEGDGADATLEAWLEDVEVAQAELLRVTRSRRLVAFGLRLGGTLAALAATRLHQRLRHLVLWDPVVDGAAYLRELAEAHRSYLRAELGARARADAPALSADGHPEEALGTPIPPALAASLAAVALDRVELRAEQVTVVTTRATPELARLEARLAGAPNARWIAVSTSVPWNSDEGLNAAIVPADAVQAIVARIDALSP